MDIFMRIIMGLLSAALCTYAGFEVVKATEPHIMGIAALLFIFGLCGVVEALRDHHRESDPG